MFEFFRKLFDTSDFMPRWQCGQWTAGHGWLHIISDLLIWAAYLAIPIILVFFLSRRAETPFRGIFWLFGMFIIACGTTHLIEAGIFWWPYYRVSGLVKAITAVVSWATVMALVPIVPKALSLRSPDELEREIAERNRAEGALRSSDARFRGLLESAPDGMVIVDSVGRIVLVNSQTQRMFGYQREELLQQPVEILIPQRFHDPHRLHRANYFRDPQVRPMGARLELYGVRRDGSEFPVEISLSPLDTKEGVLAISAIRDISDRKLAEEGMRRHERLATIGQVVTGLAHESRNALQQIQSCVGIMRLKLADRRPEVLSLLDGVQAAQDRLHRLLDDVRSYASQIKLDCASSDLADIWRESWNQLAPYRRDRAAQIIESNGLDDLQCVVDPGRIEQVFRNLFENSLAACPDPVAIEIECQESQIDGRPALRIAVRDNGPGFPPAVVDRIFDAFFTTKTHGTGLGMSIVRRVVDAHGGDVHINREYSDGAEVVIILPRGGS